VFDGQVAGALRTDAGYGCCGRIWVDQFTPAAVKPSVSVADVEKLDVRVGTILAVDGIPTSAKLLKLTVDFGDQQRTILAGMKMERSNPQEIVGLQALFVVNLEPKRMAGEVSQGMLFDIGFADGVTPVLAVPECAVPNGTRAG
jgi:tRNA-binding protein